MAEICLLDDLGTKTKNKIIGLLATDIRSESDVRQTRQSVKDILSRHKVGLADILIEDTYNSNETILLSGWFKRLLEVWEDHNIDLT